jgi:hypothetical protein
MQLFDLCFNSFVFHIIEDLNRSVTREGLEKLLYNREIGIRMETYLFIVTSLLFLVYFLWQHLIAKCENSILFLPFI